jgi:hypothetical protein
MIRVNFPQIIDTSYYVPLDHIPGIGKQAAFAWFSTYKNTQ